MKDYEHLYYALYKFIDCVDYGVVEVFRRTLGSVKVQSVNLISGAYLLDKEWCEYNNQLDEFGNHRNVFGYNKNYEISCLKETDPHNVETLKDKNPEYFL